MIIIILFILIIITTTTTTIIIIITTTLYGPEPRISRRSRSARAHCCPFSQALIDALQLVVVGGRPRS